MDCPLDWQDYINRQVRTLAAYNSVPFTKLLSRYDVRLLLHSAPKSSVKAIEVDREDGWDDLPSDAEDLFFFSQEEADDIRREKKRKLMDAAHEARLAAMKVKDTEEASGSTELDPNEEPDDAQLRLMKKTAAHIVSSPNALQFEMRILANHGEDPRFAFLRGRWKNKWEEVKASARTQPTTAPPKVVAPPSGLVTYKEDETEQQTDEQRIKAERLARVKEWARKRKEEKK
ncbi:1320_t:CDS:2 [Acaulospora colombiana]|uniref:1320_t:CDS:1 n=1 Tax=Acaulospora colombiana TaxID=27376 RepID=A0ACA9N1W5_9GLOM|nr:1320_t:CDS:2 [Acaulospora colombiana]